MTSEIEKAEAFYDQFGTKLLTDYVSGNARMEAAIAFAVDRICRFAPRRILDIGCGIGWSSHEFRRACPETRIDSVDLSANSIMLAQSLFDSSGLDFGHVDVTAGEWGEKNAGEYDVCVMLDVFEHIPESERASFLGALSGLLSDRGMVILTFPTVLHQEHLRNCNPAGLQPVDEDVDAATLIELADMVGGELIHYEFKSIWRSNDYVHAAVARNLKFEKLPAGNSGVPCSPGLEPRSMRLKRVAKMLEGKISNKSMEEVKAAGVQSIGERALNKIRKISRRMDNSADKKE